MVVMASWNIDSGVQFVDTFEFVAGCKMETFFV